MKIKLAIALLMFSGSSFATQCWVKDIILPSTSSHGTNLVADLEMWDFAQDISFDGSGLIPDIGYPSGSSMIFDGPANRSGYVIYGPYIDFPSSKIEITPEIKISTRWRPSTHRTCRKRDWKKRCVSWTHHNNETGFTVDYVLNGGGNVVYSQVFKNVNSANQQTLLLPTMECNGEVNDLEVRIHSPYGGSTRMEVHSMILKTRYNYKR